MKKKTEQERLNLYRVDMKYIRDLHRADDRVSSVSPQSGLVLWSTPCYMDCYKFR